METKKLHNYLVVILLILVIIFFSNLFSRKSPGPEVKELIAGTGQSQQQSCDPPMYWDLEGNCVDPGAGGGGGDYSGGGGGNVSTPTVMTSAATSISQTGATLNGTISSTGGQHNSSRGFNYGTTQNYGTNVSENGSFLSGNFSSILDNLACDTDYYFRAYSTNSAGTSFGNVLTFTTEPCPAPPNNENPGGTGESAPSGDNQSPSTGPSSGSTVIAPPTTVAATPTPATNPVTSNKPATTGGSSGGASIVPPPDLFLWNFGSNVYYLQVFLNNNGFLLATTGLGSPGQETRTFGPKTEEALKRFQKAYGLPVTGYYGRLTWEAMTKLQLGH